MQKILTSTVITLVIFLFTATIDVVAQGRNIDRPSRNGDTPGRNKGATGVPLDGGVAVLLTAGTAYGIKKLRDYRKSNRSNNPYT
ncbi:PID-CTERM protein-sorting domain-containing protein [Pontibacter virosus]|uniref:Uncharacterized protein n=1 Tax=Pontibacter virosus TaxID=1765052 RepID=A0A2U1AQT3_9BACT|nr:hypothetical protein [Pontibacter virosus]PVY38691.1 hypothetical protein C8E01_11528 [Pontibacter virosus]